MSNFLQDLARIFTNPYGNVTQRVTNAAIKNTFQDHVQQTAERMNPVRRAPREVSSRDEEVDQIVREFNLGHIADTIQALTGRTPQEMPIDDATTRAFIKIAERQGVTLEQIRDLLEHDIDTNIDAVPGSGVARFSFRGLTDELRQVANRLAHSMTLGNLADLFPEIEAEQTPEARRQRAEAEEARAIHPEPERRTNATVDRLLNYLSNIFGDNKPEQTLGKAIEKTFAYVAMRSDGSEQTGFLKGRKRGEVEERLRDGGLFPTSVQEKQPKMTAMERLLDSFATFMDVPGLNPNMNQQELNEAIKDLTSAQQENTTAIDRLIDRIKPTVDRVVKSGARTGMRGLRMINRGLTRLIPKRYRAGLTRLGARMGTRMASRMGVNPAIAARAGAGLAKAGPIGAVLAGVAMAGVAAYKALASLAKPAYEATLRLANMNGALAFASAQLEVGRIRRDFESASDISETGRDRLAAQNRLEEAMQPWSDMMTNLGNRIGTFGTNFLASLLETATSVKETVGEAIEWVKDMIPALKDNADAVKEDVKERRKFGDAKDSPINQWHLRMLETPFDPAKNAPRKPLGPLQ